MSDLKDKKAKQRQQFVKETLDPLSGISTTKREREAALFIVGLEENIESLEARIKELEEENEKLKKLTGQYSELSQDSVELENSNGTKTEAILLADNDPDSCAICGANLKHSPKPLTGLCKDCENVQSVGKT